MPDCSNASATRTFMRASPHCLPGRRAGKETGRKLEPLTQRYGETLHPEVVLPPLMIVAGIERGAGRKVDADARRRGVRAEVSDAIDREGVEVLDAARV